MDLRYSTRGKKHSSAEKSILLNRTIPKINNACRIHYVRRNSIKKNLLKKMELSWIWVKIN